LWLEKVPRIPRDFFVGDCCMKYWVYILHSSDEYIANLKFGIANWFDPWPIQFEIGNSHLEMSSGIRKITITHDRPTYSFFPFRRNSIVVDETESRGTVSVRRVLRNPTLVTPASC
jgi:hypothetical protein